MRMKWYELQNRCAALTMAPTHMWKQHGWKRKASGEQHLNSQLEAPAC